MTSVTIPRYRYWLTWHYDDAYPAQLYPVVGKDEFAASIARLTAAYKPDPWMKYTQAICLTIMLAGVVTFFAGIIAAATGGLRGLPVLAFAGFGTLLVGGLLLTVYRVYSSYTFGNRLLDACLLENVQHYANRLPPVQWKLQEEELIWVRAGGGYAGRSHSGEYNIVVEVGAQVVQPVVHVTQHHNYYPQQPQAQAPSYAQSSQNSDSQGVAMEELPPGYAPHPPASPYEVPPQQYHQTLL